MSTRKNRVNPVELQEDIRQQVCSEIKLKKVNKTEAAKRMGVGKTTFFGYLNGTSPFPTDVLAMLNNIYNLDVFAPFVKLGKEYDKEHDED
ncbi:hypothetical protein [Pseudoalteromonas rubra]|uniref:hypothetical protein n=1 Tax=Pseudoalteromonas rubra TaxID=43658 RepID=UPI002DB7F0EB|nr:hypothetical protein [Pseudoalteromonas rubra]MEC4091625.1 hypothetical protein [Pseudoalteromonas rubra]